MSKAQNTRFKITASIPAQTLNSILNLRIQVFWVVLFMCGLYLGISNIDSILSSFNKVLKFSVLFLLMLALPYTVMLILGKGNSKRLIGLRQKYLLIVISAVFFIAGALRPAVFNISVYQNTDQLNEKSETVYGTVVSDPTSSSNKEWTSFKFDIYGIGEDPQMSNKPLCRALVYVYNSAIGYRGGISNGDSLRLTGSFSLPAEKLEDFEYRRYLLSDKTVLTSFSYEYEKLPYACGKSFYSYLTRIGIAVRNDIASYASEVIPGAASDESALVSGILIGARADFSDELETALSDSGITHIVAVSGMHTSYLILFVGAILSIFRLKRNKIKLILPPILLLFAAASGFTPSIVRSVITSSILLLLSYFGRSNDSLTSLAYSALIITAYNPYTMLSASFVLSYCSVLGIIVFVGMFVDTTKSLSGRFKSKETKRYLISFQKEAEKVELIAKANKILASRSQKPLAAFDAGTALLFIKARDFRLALKTALHSPKYKLALYFSGFNRTAATALLLLPLFGSAFAAYPVAKMFGRFTLPASLFNILAVPCSTLIFLLGCAGWLIDSLLSLLTASPPAHIFGRTIFVLSRLIIRSAELTAASPLSMISKSPSSAVLFLTFIPCLFLYIFLTFIKIFLKNARRYR